MTMDASFKKRVQKGQALIELIIFLPIMITVYSVVSGFANSINGAINQQKITRSYFYNRLQNNSHFPGPNLVGDTKQNWTVFSVFYIGWKESFMGGALPVMPCYKVSIPFKNSPQDKCDEGYAQKNTLWIRVGTVYGVCGTTYLNTGDNVFYVPDLRGTSFNTLTDRGSCIIAQ